MRTSTKCSTNLSFLFSFWEPRSSFDRSKALHLSQRFPAWLAGRSARQSHQVKPCRPSCSHDSQSWFFELSVRLPSDQDAKLHKASLSFCRGNTSIHKSRHRVKTVQILAFGHVPFRGSFWLKSWAGEIGLWGHQNECST